MLKETLEFKPCLLIPCFNHGNILINNLENITKYKIPLIIIDDAGADSGILEIALNKNSDIILVKHKQNLGKGAALSSGFRKAQELGFSHVLQVDADGQHNYADIPLFLKYSKENPDKLILGTPIFDESAPLERIWGRKISTFFVALETLSLSAHDVLFGYRVYPLRRTCSIIANHRLNSRMGFDVQIIVYHLWEGVKIENVRSKVKYHSDINSNFRYLEDNLSFISMHVRLLGLACYFAPIGFLKRFRNRLAQLD